MDKIEIKLILRFTLLENGLTLNGLLWGLEKGVIKNFKR